MQWCALPAFQLLLKGDIPSYARLDTLCLWFSAHRGVVLGVCRCSLVQHTRTC